MKKLKWKLNKLLTEISIDQIAYHPTKLFVDQKLSPYLAQPLVPHLTKPRIRPTDIWLNRIGGYFSQQKVC